MIRVNTLFKNVCYHPEEHQLLTTGTDRKIGYWETYDASIVREVEGSMTGGVNALDVSADGRYFVSGGDDKMVKVIWAISPVLPLHLYKVTPLCIRLLSVNPILRDAISPYLVEGF